MKAAVRCVFPLDFFTPFQQSIEEVNISFFSFRSIKWIFSWVLTVLYALVLGKKGEKKAVELIFSQHLHLEEEHETTVTVKDGSHKEPQDE